MGFGQSSWPGWRWIFEVLLLLLCARQASADPSLPFLSRQHRPPGRSGHPAGSLSAGAALRVSSPPAPARSPPDAHRTIAEADRDRRGGPHAGRKTVNSSTVAPFLGVAFMLPHAVRHVLEPARPRSPLTRLGGGAHAGRTPLVVPPCLSPLLPYMKHTRCALSFHPPLAPSGSFGATSRCAVSQCTLRSERIRPTRAHHPPLLPAVVPPLPFVAMDEDDRYLGTLVVHGQLASAVQGGGGAAPGGEGDDMRGARATDEVAHWQ